MHTCGTDAESLRSLDTRASCDSADSRMGLLSGYTATTAAAGDDSGSAPDAAVHLADMELIMAHQERMPCMGGQRVELSGAQRRDMQMATLAAAVKRMRRLRYANQDCASARDRRASDIEGFFDRLDRLAVDRLHVQRYSLDDASSCPELPLPLPRPQHAPRQAAATTTPPRLVCP
ncbi:hypothetical protein H4R19_000595 [Coemansia spiralis]|nr:hypothetical protein H4R19_000595 [Coemansia spiralis]